MSLKLVELQVAIPRTQDAGRIQEQLNMRGQHLQDHITAEADKSDKRRRTRVNENNEPEDANIHKDVPSYPFQHKDTEKKNKPETEQKERHPYKGNVIDIMR
ncbi:hypothetical protein [Ferdinandcohnia sp. Marseille-Q9671]